MSGTPFLPRMALVSRATPWLQSCGLSLLGLLTLTIACGVAARHMPPSPDERGAIETIDVAMIDAAAESEARDAAADSPDQPQQAAPQLEEVRAEKAEPDRPQEQASPEAPPDDLRMASEQTRETVEKAEPMQQSSERLETAVTAPPAAQASAPAEPAEASAGRPEDANRGTTDIGSAREGERRLRDWQKRLFSHIGRNKFYPPEARKRREAGEVVLVFTLDPEGRIDGIGVARSSGSKALDAAAIETMRRSSPAPRPPAALGAQRLELPMRFALK